MRASKRANTASALAVNPDNLEHSAMRRIALLDAFQQLDEDDQADLLEAAETALWNMLEHGRPEEADLKRTLSMIYNIAGWGELK